MRACVRVSLVGHLFHILCISVFPICGIKLYGRSCASEIGCTSVRMASVRREIFGLAKISSCTKACYSPIQDVSFDPIAVKFLYQLVMWHLVKCFREVAVHHIDMISIV